MRAAILILCAVVADTAPLAAKSVTTADSELPAIATSQSEALKSTIPQSVASSSVTPVEVVSPAVVAPSAVKFTKSKKFHPSEMGLLHDGKKLLVVASKLADTAIVSAPATSIIITEVTSAPLAAAENTTPLPERDLEDLKAHVAPSFVATSLFEDEKASRYQHSALFGYSSFF